MEINYIRLSENECEDMEGKECNKCLRAFKYSEVHLGKEKKQRWLRQHDQWLGRKPKDFVLQKLRKARDLNIEIEWNELFLSNIHEPF